MGYVDKTKQGMFFLLAGVVGVILFIFLQLGQILMNHNWIIKGSEVGHLKQYDTNKKRRRNIK